jgi:hypothetical protein
MDEVFGRFMSWDETKMECDDLDEIYASKANPRTGQGGMEIKIMVALGLLKKPENVEVEP